MHHSTYNARTEREAETKEIEKLVALLNKKFAEEK